MKQEKAAENLIEKKHAGEEESKQLLDSTIHAN